MILNRFFLSVFFVFALIVISKSNLQFRIPGFSYIQTIYLYEKDVCKTDAVDEIKKTAESLKEMFDAQYSRFYSSLTHTMSAISALRVNEVRYRIILGKVTFIPIDIFPEQIFVDVGALDGVKKYSLVVKDGFVFGRVIDVWDKTSKILTVFSDDFYIDVVLPNGGRAILSGGYDGDLKIFFSVSKIDVFQSGLTIISAGDRYSSPFGLKVGFIDERGIVKSPINLNDLIFVAILSPED